MELEMNSDVESSAAYDEEPQTSSEDSSRWASLPDVCLRNVFRFLPDRDRVRANMVCHHWYSVMHSPSLWRYHYFRFNGRLRKYKQSEYISAVGYARYLGMYLHRLDVAVYPSRSSVVTQRQEQAISGLFRELMRVDTQLHSLSLRGLELKHASWTVNIKKSLVDSLIAFLRRGSSMLTSVSLTDMSNLMNQGLELLSVLSDSQGSISHLDLRHFFVCGTAVFRNACMPQIMQQLRCLTDLTLDYSCISDQVLTALSRNCLKHLSIQCCLTTSQPQVLNGDYWANLTSGCPDLKVQITVDQIINTDHLSGILQREIPLTEYKMTAFYPIEEEWSAKPLLSVLLPQYRHSLQHLTLDLKNWTESLDVELVELVKACERLTQLKVFAFLEIITVERILHLRLSLRHCHLLNIIRFKIYSVNITFEELHNQLEDTMTSYVYLPHELAFSAVVCSF